MWNPKSEILNVKSEIRKSEIQNPNVPSAFIVGNLAGVLDYPLDGWETQGNWCRHPKP